ncbi:MAG: methylenetetrahydrofolate reductase [Bacteroidales bacterium]|nr:methylenetetrahydrofolate reductase [Bacteroidales bacterium]
MKVTEHIDRAKGKTLFSLEILPPLKGESIQPAFESIERILEFGIPFIDVTWHREEFEYREVEGGLMKRVTIKKRPGTVGICAAIQNRYNIDAIPHVLCGGFTAEETENFLIDLNFLGIDNVMALRGDPVAGERGFTPEKGGHAYSLDLVSQIEAMNEGRYLDESIKYCTPTNFCIGVAGYPEKHIESPCMESDLHFLREKVRRGADYIITQMFFDNRKFFEFEKKLRETGITVPIIPGLKPLATTKQLNALPLKFKVDLPENLVKEVLKAKNDKSVREIGIEWCAEQSRELIKSGVPVIHYYSSGKTENIREVLKEIS